ncbi:hypothetical protein GF325_07135, partial [Candidatus Bathyarchaeota archaeon]|nr:hypothetical protein [Candidatus Bathyarchaeota archaeon]
MGNGNSRRGKRRPRRKSFRRQAPKWEPKTRVGKMLLEGAITSIDEIFMNVLPIKEVEIVDRLLPNLKEEVCDVKLV